MTIHWGECIFRQIPEDCTSHVGRDCAAWEWGLIECYMKHYGNKLRPAIRLGRMDRVDTVRPTES